MNLFSTVKQKISILDVISEYATLKKAGLYWKGTCPFHHERTPSFTVSPHKEIFYCFGCHAAGDVITFITKVEHCSPIEAAQHLIERYNITLPAHVTLEKASKTREERNTYYQTASVFAQWCSQQLKEHAMPFNYLLQRGITEKNITDWAIGFCPKDIKSLLTYAQKHNVLAHNLLDAHILVNGKQGLYTPFEDRIIFPIKDLLGRCVGFGGRIYKADDDRVKYYNSSDHDFFNKGSLLYGLDRAKKAIASKDAVFLVEGYTDTIIMSTHGYDNTVATLGTACTAEHLKQLSRYTSRLYVLYDGDEAGQKAIVRLVELCWQVAVDLFVIALPSDEDPASYCLKNNDLSPLIDKATDIFSFVVQQTGHNFSQKGLQDRLSIAKDIMKLIAHIPDPLKQELLLQQASDTFHIPIDALKQEVQKQKRSLHQNAHYATTKINTTPSPESSHVQQKNMQTQGNIRTRDSLHQKNLQELQATTEFHQTNKTIIISELEKKLFSAILYDKTIIEQEDRDLIRFFINNSLKDLFDAIIRYKTAEGNQAQLVNLHTLLDEISDGEKSLVSQILMTAPSLSDEHGVSALDKTEGTLVQSELQPIMVMFYKKQWKLFVHNVKLKIGEAQERGDSTSIKKILDDLETVKKMMLKRGIS